MGKTRKKNKKPKQAVTPVPEKKPRSSPSNTEHEVPVFSFDRFDDRDWKAPGLGDSLGSFLDIAPSLREYERRTWNDIRTTDRKRDHPIPRDAIIPDAQKRLEELELDEFDELWRFRFGAKWRIWGVRIGNVFKVIWWDPHHVICPSQKR